MKRDTNHHQLIVNASLSRFNTQSAYCLRHGEEKIFVFLIIVDLRYHIVVDVQCHGVGELTSDKVLGLMGST
jgi:hypothetical protein